MLVFQYMYFIASLPILQSIILFRKTYPSSMQQLQNSVIAQRLLSKNKKYYSYATQKKDNENIIQGDISSIIQKLSAQSLPKLYNGRQVNRKKLFPKCMNSQHKTNRYEPLINDSQTKVNSELYHNSINFFQKEAQEKLTQKQLKKQISHYISKIRIPIKVKCSLYQQYLSLWQETTDYLQYYLSKNTEQSVSFFSQNGNQVNDSLNNKASQLLKQQGKTIILLILKKRYQSCFQQNPKDIVNRILLAFNLNPLNDYQFVSWQKFMKIRKLISGQFNRRDMIQFIINYFFVPIEKQSKRVQSLNENFEKKEQAKNLRFDNSLVFNAKSHKHTNSHSVGSYLDRQEKQMSGSQFWSIFNSTFRKIGVLLDQNNLDCLIKRINQFGQNHMIAQGTILTRDKLRKVIHENPMFIWSQFVTLTFL